MASAAHAFFCFEVLAAAFDHREHASLQQVLDSWDTKSARHDRDESGQQTDFEQDGRSTALTPSIARLQSEASTPLSVSTNSSSSQLASSNATGTTSPPSYASRLSVTESYPLFVTWNTISRSGHKSLRGCIGTFKALPLEDGLKEYATTSAFEDTRFSPIPRSLLPSLSCSLTLLADFEDCSHAMDWALGTHGIRISFTHRYRRYGATYLPDVAVEQGWSKEETLDSLMRKAGWSSGSRHSSGETSRPWEEVKDFHVVRYTGLKAAASYNEWQEWREATKAIGDWA